MTTDILVEIVPLSTTASPGNPCAGFRAAGLNAIDLRSVGFDAAEVRKSLVARGTMLETVTPDSRIAAWRRAIEAFGLKAAKVREALSISSADTCAATASEACTRPAVLWRVSRAVSHRLAATTPFGSRLGRCNCDFARHATLGSDVPDV
jgi:hypothetical protein